MIKQYLACGKGTYFIECLCWEKNEKHYRRQRMKRDVAENTPSWSWLSLGGTVKYYAMGRSMGGDSFGKHNGKLHSYAELVSVNIEWTGAPIFSSIASTELTLRG
jgi:hypothetical protein